MAKQNGLFLKWGFCLLLLVTTLSLAVCGADQQPQTGLDTKLISNFEVFDADIRDAFRGLAEYGGLNVLMDKKVQGNATTKFLAGVTVKEAIDVLAKTNGYTCYWMVPQRTVVIGDETTYKNLDTVYTRVYNLKYADPETVAETLKVIVPKERLGIDKRSNQLVVKGNILEQENVRDAVAGLDREMPQISIELRIEETTRTALDQLGIGWSSDDFSLGFKDLKFTKILSDVTKFPLNFWEEKTNAKILAKPMVATTDSKEAMIFIGDRVPIIKKEVDDDDVSWNVEFIDVGTKLIVTPRINTEDIVTVNIKATLSNVSKTMTVGKDTDSSYDIPYVRNREASSVIRLRDGETFMLSGLNQVESSLTKNSLKGISRIPLVGKLFQNTTKKDPGNDTEIVIFITPRIIRTEPRPVPVVEQPGKAKNSPPKFDGKHLTIVVKPNQDVARIAALYGVPAAQIIAENNLTKNVVLKPGRELLVSIPAEHLYYLAPKETMWQLSKRYGVPLDILQEINQLGDVTKVNAGQAIILPVAAGNI